MKVARRLGFLSIALLCSIGHAQDRAPRGPVRSESFSWSGCQVVEFDGSVREVRCEGFVLRVFRALSLTSDAAGMEAWASTVPAEADARRGELRVGESTVPTIESTTMLFAIPYAGVGAACTDPRGERRERCRAALTEIARARRLPPGVTFPEARMSFLGRELLLPRGCTMAGTERMVCAGSEAFFDWRERPAREGESVAAAVESLARIYRARLRVTGESSVVCTMREVTTSGIALTVEVQGQPMNAVLCGALSEETLSVALCFGHLAPGQAWPVPCDQAFSGAIPAPTASR